jgi:hypothetical protein
MFSEVFRILRLFPLALPTLGKRHACILPVMPVRHDVHRTCSATFGADKAPADLRPGAILRQGIQSDVDQAIAAAVTLDVAGYVAIHGFLAGTCRTYGPDSFESEIDACAYESDAEPKAQIINSLWIGTARSYSTS